MSAEQEEPGPEEVDDEFDPFAAHSLDKEPDEGEEGDDSVHADS